MTLPARSGPKPIDNVAPLKLLWVARDPVDSSAGDSVFDRHAARALERTNDLTKMAVTRKRGSAFQRLATMVTQRLPHDRAQTYSPKALAEVLRAASDYDAMIVSHEALDWMLPSLASAGKPIVLILHNVTSKLCRYVFPKPLSGAIGFLYALYERRLYRGGDASLVVLSQADKAALDRLGISSSVMAPGAPENLKVPNAFTGVHPAVEIGGSFDWAPKRKDFRRFLLDLERLEPTPILVVRASFNAEIRERLEPYCFNGVDRLITEIGFGLITDRFVAGFKLKVLDYISRGMIVLTFADIIGEFEDIPGAENFIIKVSSPEDMVATLRRVELENELFWAEFLAFQSRILREFTWTKVSAIVEAGLGQSINSYRNSAIGGHV